MTRKISGVLVLLVLLSLSAPLRGNEPTIPKPPPTRTTDLTYKLHGVTIPDPYGWLEDQGSPETRAWIDAQNKYTQRVLGAFPAREDIRREVTRLMRIDSVSAPRVRGQRYFYTRRRAEQNLDVIYMREKGQETVLVDANPLDPEGMISATLMDVSEDGNLIAYGLRRGGADEVNLVLMDVNTRRQLPDEFPLARYGSVQITPDRKAIYYSKFIPKLGPRAYLHRISADPATDKEIFGSKYGPGESIGLDLAPDGSYLILQVRFGSAAEKVEIYYQDLKKGGPITPIVNDLKADFSVELADGRIFLETNWEAPKRRILSVDVKNPARRNWKVVVPESEHPISSTALADRKLIVSYLENVVARIKVFEPTGKFVREIKLPELGNATVSGRWQNDEAFYTFVSFSTPRTIYRYVPSTGKQEEWARVKAPIPAGQIETRQVWFESKDKTRIPMFLVMKKGAEADGNRPTLLTGYGGFRIARTPGFSTEAAIWVLNGGVYALPSLRGGSEFGEKWHRAGMLENKQNTFDDFIAAAEWLIKNKYTNPSRLAIAGASNGGLLVGAAMTQRPELFRAVVVGYPLLDMLRYHQFLVARFWVPEYGSADDPKQFQYLRAYSPYHNVKPDTKYPAVLLVTGDADTRVAPLHARKMAALLQATTGSNRPVLLHYDTRAGHARGGVAISRQIDDLTDELTFLFWQLAMAMEGTTAQTGR